MKFFIDNNLPPAYAAGLNGFCRRADLNIEVKHLGDKFCRNTPDHVWIEALAKEGEWIVLTQDGIRKNPVEIEAVRQSGLTVLVFARQWAGHEYWIKAQRLMYWWPSIIEYCALATPGTAAYIPWNKGTKRMFAPFKW